ncbi:hypothetical protein WJ47_33025 [Burkholderia ubonensis]|uniref:Calcineurin-like phosphoesterase domain-containing protein n=1 Tax=Burkholderia ubonensis TaxID=101571 RepID=A0AB73G559_9BURK|nr:phosphodiesterase [Burkholderia ubonensis]KVG69966.1 hypothetical protein WJ34_30290 [Burkholderia ubonensis]KVH18978.1 hypothetical protein WJ37_23665 [Burkholderia ubonensis]KVH49700.1 hypothetical protein WJ38_15440 [Burkholderia ubonensis]KVH86735.1 hypothetical protein WJ43_07035 [Burkholderia ubonensis]KVK94554.1 hypothetical protein WJ44_21440 [Burkholderia ubonensis]
MTAAAGVAKLIHLSDPHLVPPGERLFGLDPAARLRFAIDDINRRHADARLCVITGDLAHDGDLAAYRVLAGCLTRLIPSVRLLIGNHDRRDAFCAAFPHAGVDRHGFVQSVQDFDFGRCVFLDTLDPGVSAGRLCAARVDWLRARLDEAARRPVFLFAHHPPFELGLPSTDRARLADADADALRALIAAHGDVRHVFAGHVHLQTSGGWYGTPFSTVRGTNHQFSREFTSEPARITLDPPAYAVVLVRDSGVAIHHQTFDCVDD